MTQPTEITVSLETAKALKEAGWPQDDCIFVWGRYYDGLGSLSAHSVSVGFEGQAIAERFAAPTFIEIYSKLPRGLEGRPLLMQRDLIGYADGILVEGSRVILKPVIIQTGTLTDAVADLYIYLSTNNLL